MPKHSPLLGSPLIGSPLVAPNELPLDQAEANSPPFVWDAVHRTVIKFVEPLACQPAVTSPAHAETVVHAMQRLVAIINTLRSAQPSFLERASQNWLSDAQTLEALLPYVSEEAYDVLEAMEAEGRQKAGGRRQETEGDREARESGEPGRRNAFSNFTSPLASSAPPHPTPHTPHPTPHTPHPLHHDRHPHPLSPLVSGAECLQHNAAH